ncbi:MAG: hypothetical protein HY690_02290 [Chloroflexi bacterium]|nr:hypothetical protein [Chloroflexota bacterium]
MPTLKYPHLRSLAPRLGLVFVATILFGLAIAMNVQANVGQGPWVAFHYGLSLHTPLSLGQANVAVGVVIIIVAALLGVRPGIGTLFSLSMVSWVIDAWLDSGLVPRMSGLVEGYAMLLGGVLVSAFGTTLTVKAALGTGPRDSLMLALSSLTGLRVGLTKGSIELTAFTLGFLLGAPVGLGTLVYALSMGPAVECWFRIFGLRSPRRRRPQATPSKA